MLMWGARFFEMGYNASYINELNYWDYLELIEGFSLLSKSQSSGGRQYFAKSNGELSDTHRKLIENRTNL